MKLLPQNRNSLIEAPQIRSNLLLEASLILYMDIMASSILVLLWTGGSSSKELCIMTVVLGALVAMVIVLIIRAHKKKPFLYNVTINTDHTVFDFLLYKPKILYYCDIRSIDHDTHYLPENPSMLHITMKSGEIHYIIGMSEEGVAILKHKTGMQ